MTPLASVAMLEKLALLKIARCKSPALSSAASACLRAVVSTIAPTSADGGWPDGMADTLIVIAEVGPAERGDQQEHDQQDAGNPQPAAAVVTSVAVVAAAAEQQKQHQHDHQQ